MQIYIFIETLKYLNVVNTSILHTIHTHTLTSVASDLKVAYHEVGKLELELHTQMTMRQVPAS